MLKEFFEARALRSAAKDYALRLGPQLQKDYGFSEQYTVRQIDESVRRAKLTLKYVSLGYVAFLPEHAFKELTVTDLHASYQELRTLFQRYTNNRPTAGFEPLAENQYAIGSSPDGSQL